MRDRLARLWIENEVLRLTSQRTWELHKANRDGPSPNVIKLAYTQLLQRGYDMAVDLLGPEGLLFPEGYEFRMCDFLELEGHDAQWAFLAARGRTIGGGTSEIVRTTIGERVLGLPREPRVDQDRPWREISGL
jgi:alkylation response protein AidB-like acyl-CoA dehydrogenase